MSRAARSQPGLTEKSMSDVNYYSIQEASEKLAIPIQKMRRWDEQGVLVAQRSVGGHRRYPRELIDRLAAAAEDPEAERQFKELATVKKSLAEKHRIIQLLLDSEHRYRDLVETSHDLIWATDVQGRFTYLNNAANDIFGLAPREMQGRCFFDFESGDAHIGNRRFLSMLKRNGEIKNFTGPPHAPLRASARQPCSLRCFACLPARRDRRERRDVLDERLDKIVSRDNADQAAAISGASSQIAIVSAIVAANFSWILVVDVEREIAIYNSA